VIDIAATAIFPIHTGKSRSVPKALKDLADYVMNPQKTDGGRLISSYECSPETVDLEFELAKQQYQLLTGREQKRKNVVAYHARQSFKPGEITPEEANRIGYELALRFTKNKHAFIVCTHTDREQVLSY
jgi:hypothetical protein